MKFYRQFSYGQYQPEYFENQCNRLLSRACVLYWWNKCILLVLYFIFSASESFCDASINITELNSHMAPLLISFTLNGHEKWKKNALSCFICFVLNRNSKHYKFYKTFMECILSLMRILKNQLLFNINKNQESISLGIF